jgi:hypothetical protein
MHTPNQVCRWSSGKKEETKENPKPAQGFISRGNAGETIYDTSHGEKNKKSINTRPTTETEKYAQI